MLSAVSLPAWLPGRARLRTSTARDLVAIGLLAFALRLAWAAIYGRVDAGPHDALFYEIAASNLADGHGYTELFGGATARWPPGFPFLVSLMYDVFGTHVKLGLALNVLLGSATAPLLYLIGRELFDRAGRGWPGSTFAILPAPIFFTGLFLSETTFIFMLVGFVALALYLPDRRWTPVVAGVAVGLAALTSGEGLLMPTIPLAMWWGQLPRRAWLRRGRRAGRRWGSPCALDDPQRDRDGRLHPGASNASGPALVGPQPEANGGGSYAPPSLLARISAGRGSPETQHEVERGGAAAPRGGQVGDPQPAQGAGPDPAQADGAGNETTNRSRRVVQRGRRPRARQSSLVVFNVLGRCFGYFLMSPRWLARAPRPAPAVALHPAMRGVLAYLAVCLVTYGFVYYGQYRYRLPMEPIMILVATPLLVSLWQGRRALREGL